jgi:ATP-dependent DNA helicase RecQ
MGRWSPGDAELAARVVLGITLTPSQHEALAALADSRDTLAVLPTGSGKSAIYQVGGLLLGGLTVVVSPLIALQRDQTRALERAHRSDGRPVRVALLNSAQGTEQRSASFEQLRSGVLDFLLLGPEQLANAQTHLELLASPRDVTLLAIDEAHLVSEWGHDFRPEYLRLGGLAEALGRPPILALTATAAPPVQADITRQLGMRAPAVVVADFDRPNIALAVRRADVHAPEQEAIAGRTVEVIVAQQKPALVYTMSHAMCEEVARRLVHESLRAAPYHAGLSATRRTQVQDGYFAGDLDVVVATSAFGMGIDKHDVRTVVHAGVPSSLDDYYQEVGRAGRDGLPAQAILVYDSRTLRIPRLFAARSRVAHNHVTAVVKALAAGRMSLADLARSADVSRQTAERVVAELEELGLVTVDDVGVAPAATDGLPDADEQVERAVRRRQAILGSRIDSIRHYAETVYCRRAELLAYFGEALDPPCRNCDNDAAADAPTTRPAPAVAGDIGLGASVTHRLWGPGILLSRDEHELVVAFESVGYRHLTPAALTNGLLNRA